MEDGETFQYNPKNSGLEMVTCTRKVLRDVKAFRNCEQIVRTAEAFRISMKWQDASEAYISGVPIFRWIQLLYDT